MSKVGVSKLVQTILEGGGGELVRTKKKFADILDIPPEDSAQWLQLFDNGTKSSYDLFYQFIATWIHRNGEQATIGNLTEILKQNEFKSTSEDVSELGAPTTQISVSITHAQNITHDILNGDMVSPPIHNFVGRTEELAELQQQFQQRKCKCLVISGTGGQGKSELSKKFIQVIKTDDPSSPIITWLRGDSVQQLTSSLAQLAINLSLANCDPAGRPLQLQRLVQSIAQKIADHFPNNIWLVLLDNVDEEYPELKETVQSIIRFPVFIIITSRRNNIFPGEAHQLKLQSLYTIDAHILVKNALQSSSDEDVLALCKLLGNHALALQISIAYIRVQQNNGCGIFLKDFQRNSKMVLQHQLEMSDYDQTIYTIVITTMTFIFSNHEAMGVMVQLVGDILGLILPDGIHINILDKLVQTVAQNRPSRNQMSSPNNSEDNPVSWTPHETEEVVLLLAKFSMVSVTNNVVSVHRLVQVMFREEFDWKDTVDILLKHTDLNDSSLEELRQMMSIWEHADPEIVKKNPNVAHGIFNRMLNLSLVLELNGFAENNHTHLTQILGPDQNETLSMEHSVAFALNEVGDYEVSLTKARKLLDKKTNIFGEEHPSTLITASLIISNLMSLNRYEEALEKLDEFIESTVKVLGENHIAVMIGRNNKALVLNKLGRSEEALPIFQQLLQTKELQLGPSHPSTLATRIDITDILFDQKRFDDAKTEFEAIMKLQVKVFGEEHQSTLEKVLGPNHPETNLTRNKLYNWKDQIEHQSKILTLEFKNVRQWEEKVVKGRRFLKGTPRLAIAEAMLSILPATVVLFFFPISMRKSSEVNVPQPNACIESRDEYNNMDLVIDKVIVCLEQKCSIFSCEKILFLNQVVVPMFDLKVLSTLVNEEFDVNIMVDNPQGIARLSQDIEISPLLMNTGSCDILKSYSKDFFSKFDELRGDQEKIRGQVVVGVIDGGAELNDDIRSRCNFENDMQITNQPRVADVGEYSDANTEIKHGTNIVRIIAQSCSPDTTIVVYQAFDANLQANYDAIVVAFSRARKRGVDFLNCSFSIKPEDTFTAWQVNAAIKGLFARKGSPRIIPICSAGNLEELMDVQPPATSRHCVSVGAHTFDDCFCSFSSGRCAADIATFGEGVVPPLNRGEVMTSSTIYMKGTSFSTAVLTGFLTHVLPIGGNYYRDPRNIKTLLQTTAGPLRQCLKESHNSDCKKKLNVKRAYQEAKRNQSPTLPP